MNITTLSIENVKRLSAIRITADGKPIVLTGNNGAGKSSVLDGILLALSGAGLEDPIKHGATRAVIKLKIEGKEEALNIERIIRPGSRELKVTYADRSALIELLKEGRGQMPPHRGRLSPEDLEKVGAFVAEHVLK